MRIGVIDSGKGALGVILKLNYQDYDWVVIMDDAYFPYGTKSKEFLLKRSLYLVHYLIRKKVDKIIIACNTLSLVAIDFLRFTTHQDITGVFDYLVPYLNRENILIGSRLTCRLVQEKFPMIPTFDGTSLIAAIQHKQPVEEEISIIKQKCSSACYLILGCTHFLFLDASIFGIPTLDPIMQLQRQLKKDLS